MNASSPKPSPPSKPGSRADLFVGDVVDELPKLVQRFGHADLIVADPPHNLKQKYDDYDDALSPKEYKDRYYAWMAAIDVALDSRGSVWLTAAAEHAPFFHVHAVKQLGWTWCGTPLWIFHNGQQRDKHRFTQGYMPLMYFSKHHKFRNFNRDAEPGISDAWVFPTVDRIAGNCKERLAGVPVQLPLEVVDRIVRLTSLPDALIFEPFCGGAPARVVCRVRGRRYAGIDCSPKTIAIAQERNHDHLLRPLDEV